MRQSSPKVIVIIPARYGSTRLPGKPLLDLAGKPVIQHVYERASLAQLVDQVLVATDDQRIAQAVNAFGGQVVMTSPNHQTGTDRIAEVASNFPSEIVVNVQGDEPFIEATTIDRAVEPLLSDDSLMMSTTCEPLSSMIDLFNANVVKVVLNSLGNALYFSRSAIPFPRKAFPIQLLGDEQAINTQLAAYPELCQHYYKHTGLYVYRRTFLLDFTTWPRSPLEEMESLEQLRVLEQGYSIRVIKVTQRSLSIDTPDDMARARAEFNK